MGRRGRRDKPKRGRDTAGWEDGYKEIAKENERFVEYYKGQGIVPEEEWDEFFTACKAPLPVTFRITGTSEHDPTKIRDALLNEYIPYLKGIVWDGEEVQPPSPLPFYPDELAWQIRVGKTVIRKSAPFSRFQKFLVSETEVGNISRQEAVSMIPPLLLDVKPEHTVIDMCAAPGSKTAQIIEALHAVPEPTGLVVANDKDYKRAHMLIHQVKRLNSPNLVIVSHDAKLFPRIAISETHEASGRVIPTYLKYDRVLCDVPCSGDGTMRKNINVWRDWNTGNGAGLHNTQYEILVRGLHHLKVGGKLVYSTCSLNPIENEAVVARALRDWKGCAKLVDCSNELPQLIRRPGMTDWKVMGKDKEWATAPTSRISEHFFPKDDLKELGIEHCMRVYPHLQDTGGFFITVFEKTAEYTDAAVKAKRKAEEELSSADAKKQAVETTTEASESPAPVAVAEETTTEAEITEVEAPAAPVAPVVAAKSSEDATPKKVRLPRDANEEPFKFLDPDHPALEEVYKFYTISADFPRESLLVRNASGDPMRSIYYVHPNVRPVITLNEKRLKLLHAGVKVFTIQKTLEGVCPWRVQSDGLFLLYRHIAEQENGRKCRTVVASKEFLFLLCEHIFHRIELIKDENVRTQIEGISEGCMFLEVDLEDGRKPVIYPMWRGKMSTNLMLAKQDTQELMLRVFKVHPEAPAAETAEKAEASEKVAEDVKEEAEVATEVAAEEAAEEPAVATE
ncbi:S-adenosyl-L-methionine-dependent methyltransferase [Myxozyma melibiosi]|uniref:S-adenosyl-L-methionine-dependent methyltransferase n=1 Tax=Myxozyma melibiosi TaxID=54550 RepID=A0ABR1FDT4_9ASCO